MRGLAEGDKEMEYKAIVKSRKGTTVIYQGEDNSLVEVFYCKSGAVEAQPISQVPADLTVKATAGEIWETEPITKLVRFPAER